VGIIFPIKKLNFLENSERTLFYRWREYLDKFESLNLGRRE
jgi:hypothetical protein